MKIGILIAALAGAALFAGFAYAQSPAPPAVPKLELRVHVGSIKYSHPIPSEYAFCEPAAQGHVAAAPDKSPRISWSKGPAGTKSYAIIGYDTDSPAEHREWMNKEG